MINRVPLPFLRIQINNLQSNVLAAKDLYDDCDLIILYAPSTLDALEYRIEVTDDVNAGLLSTWRTLQVGDPYADATVGEPGKARSFFELANAAGFRIAASGPVASNRTWLAEKGYSL